MTRSTDHVRFSIDCVNVQHYIHYAHLVPRQDLDRQNYTILLIKSASALRGCLGVVGGRGLTIIDVEAGACSQ